MITDIVLNALQKEIHELIKRIDKETNTEKKTFYLIQKAQLRSSISKRKEELLITKRLPNNIEFKGEEKK